MSVRLKLLLAIVIAVLLGLAFAYLVSQMSIPNEGQLVTVGIEAYWDENLTEPVELIDWGTLTINQSKSVAFWLHNNGTANVSLTMSVSNWTFDGEPDAYNYTDYFNVTWSAEGGVIKPNEKLLVTVTLTTKEEVPPFSHFEFLLTITATEVEE